MDFTNYIKARSKGIQSLVMVNGLPAINIKRFEVDQSDGTTITATTDQQAVDAVQFGTQEKNAQDDLKNLDELVQDINALVNSTPRTPLSQSDKYVSVMSKVNRDFIVAQLQADKSASSDSTFKAQCSAAISDLK